ncbi:carbohydrate-binding module family 13 protein [Rhizophagus clarus]|uniref:Carbohydrate-binding module family 13 protein n=1 Tax=Rhizophagus clarus TaxID=94130 RepID=A0A8H3MC76_9GLOM|nr:carbohydrate-binding module family 13 protein [Rhizophagus clarus]
MILTLVHIKLPNILPEIFQIILRYIYGGRLSLEEYDASDIIKILVASRELSLKELVIHLQSFLIENKKTWDYVLKWGIAQNPELPSDPSNYSKNDFNTLKNTLQHFVPLIKFFNLTPKEYLSQVYPYKKVIPKDLRENLFKHFIDQPNSSTPEPKTIIKEVINSKSIDSKIITIQHAEVISKWVEKLEITDVMKNSYEFKLILRGSRDGFSSCNFHKICDNKTRTITIIKVKGSNEILGGYNPIVWKSNGGFGGTEDSFIFSFKNKENIDENHILSRISVFLEEYAIYNHTDYGPSFGENDLVLFGENCYDKSYCNYSGCYDESIRRTKDYFSVEEYKIFQIIKD